MWAGGIAPDRRRRVDRQWEPSHEVRRSFPLSPFRCWVEKEHAARENTALLRFEGTFGLRVFFTATGSDKRLA
jgi:hypothetical protein